METITSLAPFTTKIANKAENVRPKRAEKVPVSLRNRLLRRLTDVFSSPLRRLTDVFSAPFSLTF